MVKMRSLSTDGQTEILFPRRLKSGITQRKDISGSGEFVVNPQI